MRLTEFEKWLLLIIIFAILPACGYFIFVWNICLNRNMSGFAMVIFFVPIVYWLIIIDMFSQQVNDIFAFKYKIEEDKSILEKYEAKVLMIKYCFIPSWGAVSTNSHDYEVQNIFGAKSTRYFSSDIKFTSYEEAKKAIETHKGEITCRKNKFFERPKKKKKKTTYL